jgi:hypothetical protein
VHGEYENTQLEKSQKSQGQDFCRFLLLCIEAEIAPTRKFKPSQIAAVLFFCLERADSNGKLKFTNVRTFPSLDTLCRLWGTPNDFAA